VCGYMALVGAGNQVNLPSKLAFTRAKSENRAASRARDTSFGAGHSLRGECGDVGRWSTMVGSLIDRVRRGSHGCATRGHVGICRKMK
jgi:hypothetical protein